MINHKDFVGKTIEKMDTDAVNEVIFYFTDGSQAALEAQSEIPSLGFYSIQQVQYDNKDTTITMSDYKRF